MSSAPRSSSPDAAKSEKCLRLRPSSVLAACILMAAAVVLAYLGGVMSGRAYCVIQPPQAAGQKPAARTPPPSGEARSAEQPRQEEEPRQQILAPEELRFARVLRGENPLIRPAPAPVVPVRPQSAPQAGTPAQVQAPGGQSPGAEVSGGQIPPAPQVPAAKMHDYVFQVAALNSEESVDALRQRLEGRGLRTRMQRSGKLYVVLVLLRGDDARAAEVVRAAESMGLGKPLQRSRKPALPQ